MSQLISHSDMSPLPPTLEEVFLAVVEESWREKPSSPVEDTYYEHAAHDVTALAADQGSSSSYDESPTDNQADSTEPSSTQEVADIAEAWPACDPADDASDGGWGIEDTEGEQDDDASDGGWGIEDTTEEQEDDWYHVTAADSFGEDCATESNWRDDENDEKDVEKNVDGTSGQNDEDGQNAGDENDVSDKDDDKNKQDQEVNIRELNEDPRKWPGYVISPRMVSANRMAQFRKAIQYDLLPEDLKTQANSLWALPFGSPRHGSAASKLAAALAYEETARAARGDTIHAKESKRVVYRSAECALWGERYKREEAAFAWWENFSRELLVTNLLCARDAPSVPAVKAPHIVCCKECGTVLEGEKLNILTDMFRYTAGKDVLRYAEGKAYLTTGLSNTYLSPSTVVHTTISGTHLVRDQRCLGCRQRTGHKYIKADGLANRWKQGKCVVSRRHLLEISGDTDKMLRDGRKVLAARFKAIETAFNHAVAMNKVRLHNEFKELEKAGIVSLKRPQGCEDPIVVLMESKLKTINAILAQSD